MMPRLKQSMQILIFLFFTTLLTQARSDCPEHCSCSIVYKANSEEPLNEAKCYEVSGLKGDYGKRSNINSLDLSDINLQRLTLNLEQFKFLTELNLSDNNLTDVNILNKHIINLSLANNLLTPSKLSKIPEYVQHLDLSHNKLTSVPSDIMKLTRLQSLELSGNPIDCNCETIIARNWLQDRHIWSNKHVQCRTPEKYQGSSWFQVKESDVCHHDKKSNDGLSWKFDDDDELMLADDPSVVYDGSGEPAGDDLSENFIPVGSVTTLIKPDDEDLENEGSGEVMKTHAEVRLLPDNEEEDGSGDEGSGLVPPLIIGGHFVTFTPEISTASSLGTTPELEDYENKTIIYDKPGIFGSSDAVEESINKDNAPSVDSPKSDTEAVSKVKSSSSENESPNSQLKKENDDDDTGLYILLVVIGVVFICLLIVVVVRRQSAPTKRSYDPEAANQRGKELQPMNKTNIGKPADYEYIPLMGEKPVYKPPNSADTPTLHSFKPSDEEIIREPLLKANVESTPSKPLDNGVTGSKDSVYENIPSDKSVQPPQDSNPDPPIPAVRTIPPEVTTINDDTDSPKINEPIQNGIHAASPYQNDDDVFLPNNNTPNNSYINPPPDQTQPSSSPTNASSRYSPVYSPETGRVKVKLIHTPKPKTPLLVNRTRSAAGDLIDTPASFSPRSARK